ncbi:peptidoglycan-binding domain-containing protein [Streptomyces xanthophaeus]|uniref:peptidoglycan-binding domain-containing protein n=1 Tax=Streptomyces xanthophaeus TaxID=67385 RepID=UPI002F909BFA|nr:peptidoglycan-binding protein [Streptomyces xanthophaeus]WST65789.1 peptidoglycan-binding protein [Streptomyces xanthophaeus]
MHASVRAAFLPFSEPLEGRLHFMYLDVKSLVSTGVGNLLDADNPANFGSNPVPLADIFTLAWFDKDSSALASSTEIKAEYTKVKFSGTAFSTIAQKKAITRLRISDKEIDVLVTNKLDSFETSLKTRAPFADMDDWPADGQLGLLSMAWAMGPFFNFPKFQNAATAGDWLAMARECKMTEAGNPGVIPRNVRNALLFTLAGWMVAPPPGDFTQLVYDPTQNLAANMRSGNLPVPLNLVVGLQTALEALGFNPNGLDGVIGPGTRTALTSFQSANGLTQTPAVQDISGVPQATIDALATQLDDAGIGRFP